MTVSILAKFEKQPAEVLDYDVSFGRWFANRIDEISTHTFVITRLLALDTETPPSLHATSTSVEGRVVKVVLAGGVAGEKYRVGCRITTTAGLTKEAEFDLRVREV